jgi:streptogramin lyase
MVGDSFKRVLTGQRASIAAEVWNYILDAAEYVRAIKQGVGGQDVSSGVPQATFIKVQNGSGVAQARFAILTLGSPMVTPEANLEEFQDKPNLVGDVPSLGPTAGNYCILYEPMEAGAIGRGTVSGVSPVLVLVDPSNLYGFAEVTPAQTGWLTNQAEGSARVLWLDSLDAGSPYPANVRWALVLVGAGAVGSTGPAGQRGARGYRGKDGEDGRRGPRGISIPGPQGGQGRPGGHGRRGKDGEDGRRGPRGITVVGPQGEKGDTGDTGLVGARGKRGNTGEDGRRGARGFSVVGPQGQQGIPGTNGINGTDGLPGRQGRRGRDGEDGGRSKPRYFVMPGAGGIETETSLASSLNASVFLDSVEFTATVTGSSTPEGVVEFFSDLNGMSIGVDELSGSGGSATASVTNKMASNPLIVGSHTVTAVYHPDSGFSSSRDNITQTVNNKFTPYIIYPGFLISPECICAGPDGNLWIADANVSNKMLWKITTSGVATSFSLTTGMWGICSGPDGNLWGAGNSIVWRVTTAGVITPFTASTHPPQSVAQNICVGSDGNLWYIAAGNTLNKVTTSGTITLVASLPSNCTCICSGSDGNLWIGMASGQDSGTIARVTTSGTVTTFTLTDGTPNGICSGSDGNLWLTDQNGILWVVTTSGSASSYNLRVPSGRFICSGPDNNLWLTVTNYVVRVTTSGVATYYNPQLPFQSLGNDYVSSGFAPNFPCVGPDSNIWCSNISRGVWKIVPS